MRLNWPKLASLAGITFHYNCFQFCECVQSRVIHFRIYLKLYRAFSVINVFCGLLAVDLGLLEGLYFVVVAFPGYFYLFDLKLVMNSYVIFIIFVL